MRCGIRVSGWAVTDQRHCPRGHAEGCVGTAYLGLLLQLVCSVLRDGAFTATGRRLDQSVENVGLDADVVMLPSGGGRGERFGTGSTPDNAVAETERLIAEALYNRRPV